MITGLIEDWKVDIQNNLPVIQGFIYKDKKQRFPDGRLICTSPIQTSIDNLCEGLEVKTINSIYRLGRQFCYDPT